MSPEDDQRLRALADELLAMNPGNPLVFEIRPQDAFSFIAALQLAYRHPELAENQRRLVRSFVEFLMDGLRRRGPIPTLEQLVVDGWNPAKDTPRGFPP